jgi:hypothetical protein
MTDAARDSVVLSPFPSTVAELRALVPPHPLPKTGRVAPTEYHVFMVRALLLGWKVETDSDIHLVLAAPGDTTLTMIAEIPNIACAGSDVALVYHGMLEARAAALKRLGTPTAKFKRFPVPVLAVVTGVGFFDFIHGQTGVAPNGIELHPTVAIAFADP